MPRGKMPSEAQLSLAALCRIPHVSWYLIAREGQRPGGLERLLSGEVSEDSPEARQTALALRLGLVKIDSLVDDLRPSFERAITDGADLVTVLDDEYPINLRRIFNLPPFLFYRGRLMADDIRAVAVVGTRDPSKEGLHRAWQMARSLSTSGVTVLSGLAKGIDAAAHTAAIEADGRTIAVMGTGILRTYPRENEALAERIVESGGALVSQFLPDQPPTRYTFPWRNVVMSGLGQGTVVIEATRTSGAKMQARLSLDHGKKVFLLTSLVTSQMWAQKDLGRGAIEVDSVDGILAHLNESDEIRTETEELRQLSLAL